jgi:hypothetical protein
VDRPNAWIAIDSRRVRFEMPGNEGGLAMLMLVGAIGGKLGLIYKFQLSSMHKI